MLHLKTCSTEILPNVKQNLSRNYVKSYLLETPPLIKLNWSKGLTGTEIFLESTYNILQI